MIEKSFSLAFKEMAKHFNSKKLKLPTEKWNDITQSAHSKAFVIAGVTKVELLESVFDIMNKCIKEGKSYNYFRTEFRKDIVKHGWLPDDKSGKTPPLPDKEEIANELLNGAKTLRNLPKSYQKYLGWRTRVIYETNISTAYNAARWQQQTDPDLLKIMPYIKYVHAYERNPKNPRKDHKSWDGKILPATDVWWEKHYPPNGFGCSCGTVSLTEREAARELGLTPSDERLPLSKVEEKLSEFDWNAQRRKGWDRKADKKILGEWAYNPGMNNTKGEISLINRLNELKQKGGAYKDIAEKSLNYLNGHSAEIYANSLDFWAENINRKTQHQGRETRTIGIFENKLITINEKTFKHGARDGDVNHTPPTKEQIKLIPTIINNNDGIYKASLRNEISYNIVKKMGEKYLILCINENGSVETFYMGSIDKSWSKIK